MIAIHSFLPALAALSFLSLAFTGCLERDSSASAQTEKEPEQKRALIVVTNHTELGDTGRQTGWHLAELTHVYHPLVEAGYAVEIASPQGGLAKVDPKSLQTDDPLNRAFVEDEGLFANGGVDTIAMAQVDPARYSIIYFSGGHGTMWDFPDNADIQRVAAAVYEQGGIVSAVCHGPAALVNVRLADGSYLVAGKEVSPFTDSEEEAVKLTEVVPFLLESTLRERGTIPRPGGRWQDKVSVSERLVTGQNPRSAGTLAVKVLELAAAEQASAAQSNAAAAN